MRYLMRAARRSISVGVMQARPAIPSRSPLAEADQRLNLDSFAAQFMLSSVAERIAQPLEEEDSTPRPISEPQAVSDAVAEGPPSPIREHERKARRVTSRREMTRTQSREESQEESPAHVSPQLEAHLARPGEQPLPRVSETSTPPQKSSARPNRRANALPAPALDEGRTLAPDRVQAESTREAGREQTPAAEAASETMLSALSRAMSWVEGQPPRAREAKRGDERAPTPSMPPRSRVGESGSARPGRATTPRRDMRPMTHLEIGKIEVEVIPPPKPAPQTAPARPVPKTNGFGSALRQTFGWRQR